MTEDLLGTGLFLLWRGDLLWEEFSGRLNWCERVHTVEITLQGIGCLPVILIDGKGH